MNAMRQTLGAAVLAALPSLAAAQQVPAIQASASAAASASAGTMALTDEPASTGGAHGTQLASAAVPATMPPPIALLSPSRAVLNTKEKRALSLSQRWKNRNEMPHAGEDGYVRFLFGATLPTVVCAPLQICNLTLQPGEIVNSVNLGDSVRWKVTPALSGNGGTQTTHLIIKATDAGLTSSLDIETDRRSYAVKLVSTEAQWMPLVAFNYPDDAQAQWKAYQQQVAFGSAGTTLPTGENTANLQFMCVSPATGGPSWAPTRAYTDGAKTYIEFPSSIAYQAAPALVTLANDGGLFSGPSQQFVNYRMAGSRYVVDAMLDKAALISGVGGDQQRVVLTRGKDCK